METSHKSNQAADWQWGESSDSPPRAGSEWNWKHISPGSQDRCSRESGIELDSLSAAGTPAVTNYDHQMSPNTTFNGGENTRSRKDIIHNEHTQHPGGLVLPSTVSTCPGTPLPSTNKNTEEPHPISAIESLIPNHQKHEQPSSQPLIDPNGILLQKCTDIGQGQQLGQDQEKCLYIGQGQTNESLVTTDSSFYGSEFYYQQNNHPLNSFQSQRFQGMGGSYPNNHLASLRRSYGFYNTETSYRQPLSSHQQYMFSKRAKMESMRMQNMPPNPYHVRDCSVSRFPFDNSQQRNCAMNDWNRNSSVPYRFNPYLSSHSYSNCQSSFRRSPPAYSAIETNPEEIKLSYPVRQGVLLKPFQLAHDVAISTYDFILNDATYQILTSRPDLELHLKCFHGNDKHMSNNWPRSLSISVNDIPMDIDRVPRVTSPGSTNSCPAQKPLNIKPFCHVGKNIVSFNVCACCCSHLFMLHLVHIVTLKSAVINILKKYTWSYQESFNKFQRLVAFMNCPLDGLQLSLMCPLSRRRLSIPARGVECQHVQCFDLQSYLRMNCDQFTWRCPLCCIPVPIDGLMVDQYTMNIVNSSTDLEVIISADGTWKPLNSAVYPGFFFDFLTLSTPAVQYTFSSGTFNIGSGLTYASNKDMNQMKYGQISGRSDVYSRQASLIGYNESRGSLPQYSSLPLANKSNSLSTQYTDINSEAAKRIRSSSLTASNIQNNNLENMLKRTYSSISVNQYHNAVSTSTCAENINNVLVHHNSENLVAACSTPCSSVITRSVNTLTLLNTLATSTGLNSSSTHPVTSVDSEVLTSRCQNISGSSYSLVVSANVADNFGSINSGKKNSSTVVNSHLSSLLSEEVPQTFNRNELSLEKLKKFANMFSKNVPDNLWKDKIISSGETTKKSDIELFSGKSEYQDTTEQFNSTIDSEIQIKDTWQSNAIGGPLFSQGCRDFAMDDGLSEFSSNRSEQSGGKSNIILDAESHGNICEETDLNRQHFNNLTDSSNQHSVIDETVEEIPNSWSESINSDENLNLFDELEHMLSSYEPNRDL